MRRAWIEILKPKRSLRLNASLSMRRAWIEIFVFWGGRIYERVALHAESVDRNVKVDLTAKVSNRSLSMRRAWIEIIFTTLCIWTIIQSLSMRRAWIEITRTLWFTCAVTVALHAESVDRNDGDCCFVDELLCRSPCGERG